MPSAVSPHSRIGLKLILSLGSLIISLMIVEGVLRCTTPPPKPDIVFDVFEKKLHTDHFDEFSRDVSFDPDLFWCLSPNKRLPDDSKRIRGIVSNAEGFREDHDIPMEKPADQIRILFLGDSCTFGFGVLHYESIVEKTERLLELEWPGVDVECINAGVPGYSAYQGLELLIKRGLQYNPDIVVTTFGWNDSREWASFSDREHHEAYLRSQPPGLLQHSVLCQRLWTGLNRPPSREGHVMRVPPAEFAPILEEINQRSTSAGARSILVAWPFQENFVNGMITNLTPYQSIIRSTAKGEVVDLLPVMQAALQAHAMNELFIDHGHTWALANDYIAKAIASQITAGGTSTTP
jgi:lysophospholipase L1-like esterase